MEQSISTSSKMPAPIGDGIVVGGMRMFTMYECTLIVTLTASQWLTKNSQAVWSKMADVPNYCTPNTLPQNDDDLPSYSGIRS
jgi:hypothetical protein